MLEKWLTMNIRLELCSFDDDTVDSILNIILIFEITIIVKIKLLKSFINFYADIIYLYTYPLNIDKFLRFNSTRSYGNRLLQVKAWIKYININ